MEPTPPAPPSNKVSSDFVRNFVFGVEDSLVSTIGLVSGVAAAGATRSTLILTGVVLIFVEAFSMAAGSLISDNSVREYKEQEVVPMKSSYWSSIVMFVSYFLSGFLILAPYIFLGSKTAFVTSIAIALVSLFILGLYVGKISGIPPVKRSLMITLIGGVAILLGVAVGMIADMFLL